MAQNSRDVASRFGNRKSSPPPHSRQEWSLLYRRIRWRPEIARPAFRRDQASIRERLPLGNDPTSLAHAPNRPGVTGSCTSPLFSAHGFSFEVGLFTLSAAPRIRTVGSGSPSRIDPVIAPFTSSKNLSRSLASAIRCRKLLRRAHRQKRRLQLRMQAHRSASKRPMNRASSK